MMALMDHEDFQEMNHMNVMESLSTNRTPRQKSKLFDSFFMNYSDFHFPEVGADYLANEIHDYQNNMHVSNEFDPFNDVLTALQPRAPQNEEFFPDANAFFYPKGFNTVHPFEDKMGKIESGINHEDNVENAGTCPLKSFMDTQRLLQEALRKASVINGNAGFRKNSFDLF